MQLARNIAAQRRSLGWTQVDLAAALGWSEDRVSNLETGRTRADIADLIALCRALGVPLRDLAARFDADDRTALGL